MRRTASEILQDLEIRVARLEKQGAKDWDSKIKERHERYRREEKREQIERRERHDRRREEAIRATGNPKTALHRHLRNLEAEYNIRFDRRSLDQSELTRYTAYNPKDIEDLLPLKHIMRSRYRSGQPGGEVSLVFYHLSDKKSDITLKVKFHFLP